MGEAIKINMPFHRWIEIQKKFEEVNKKLPENKKLDFEKYKFCSRWGLLFCHLTAVEIGAFEDLFEPEYYNN